jgi:hypothetical protein
MPTQIKRGDIDLVGDDTTVIKGAAGRALANSLIQKHGVTLAELAHGGHPVDPENISIDDSGRVTIKDRKFHTAVKDRMNKSTGGDGFFDTNCQCNPK